MSSKFRILVCSLLAIFLMHPALAQVTSAGSISGQVADSTGAVIPQAKIIATQVTTNVQWSALSDNAGNYIFLNLPVGTFNLTAQRDGFSKNQINQVILNAGENLRKNFALKPGQVSDTIEVNSEVLSVDTETANVGAVVSSTEIQQLPLVTRNFIQLVQIEPGVSSDIGSTPGFGSNSGLSASINGVRENANNWTIDGVPNLDVYNSNNAIVPDVDALAEFRVDRGNYTAEQGRSAGATINAILKQGTNEFHGSAFEFVRNTSLNANSYFNNLYSLAKSPDHYNNWGYTFGGPIKKDKLFFFWSEEWRRIIEANGTAQALLPTDAEKTGNFADYSAIGVQQPLVPTSLAGKTGCTGCVAGNPFPNNQIPTGVLNKNAELLLKYYFPTAGTYSTGYNYASSLPTTTTVREELIRMDYNLNDKWKVFAHYIQDQNHIKSPYGQWNENVLPNVAGTTEFEPLHSFALNIVGTLTPNLINEIQFGIFHNIIRIKLSDEMSRERASGLDIPYYFDNHTNVGDRIPLLGFKQYSGITTYWPFLNGFFYHKWSDNLSWHVGAHNFRFGLLVTQQGKNEDNEALLTNGSFNFEGLENDANHTGNAMADMLTGFADTYGEEMTNPMQHLRYWDDEAYAQDQWQVNHKLSLTYGIRYTYLGPEIDQKNLLSNFLPGLYSSSLAPTVDINGNLTNIPASQMTDGTYMPMNGMIVAGETSPYGNAIFSTNKLNLAPRVGFSYDLFGKGKTAIRGGYGLYYDRTAPYELGAKSNSPFNSSVTLHNVSVDNPRSGSATYATVGETAFNVKYTNPYSQQWSLGVQHEVMRNMVLNLDYIGTKGTHLLYLSQLNQNTNRVAVANGTSGVDQSRPYLGYGAIGQYTPEASSLYHGLQASLREQLGSALTLSVAYTYSKVLTDSASDTTSPQDSGNMKAERGPANFDRAQMLVANYVWQLPAFKGSHALVRNTLGGWSWSGLINVQTGKPVTVSLNEYLQTGVSDSTQRPNLVAKAQDGKGRTDWLNMSAFAYPTKGSFGNAPIGVARLPRNTQMDSSLSKDFQVYGKVHAQFRLEAINVLNHTLFNSVDSSYYTTSTTFGQLNSAANPRTTQAGLHFSF